MTATVRQVTSVGDLCADHIGDRITIRTPDHGIVAGRLVHIERDDSPRKYRLALAGEGDWTAAIPVRVHSPVVVTP